MLEKIKRGQTNEHGQGPVSKVDELNTKVEEYENISELLQTQVVWLNKDNAKLTQAIAERDARCKDLEGRVQLLINECAQKSELIEKLSIETSSRRAELDKRIKELREARDAMGFLQHVSDRSSFQLKLSSYNEEELKRKIQYFKTEALSIADKLGNAQKDKSIWEEKFKQQQIATDEMEIALDLFKREMAEERSHHRKEIEEAREHLKIHYSNMQELEAELHKRGEGFEKLGVTLKAKQSAMDQLNEHILRLTGENESLRKQLADTVPVIRTAKDSVLRLESELTRSEIQIADYEQLQQDNGILKHRCFSLEKDALVLHKEIDALAGQKHDLEDTQIQVQNNVEQLQGKIAGLERQLQEAKLFEIACQQLTAAVNNARLEHRAIQEQVCAR